MRRYKQCHPGNSVITKSFIGVVSNPCVDCRMETTPHELECRDGEWVASFTPGTKEFYLVKDSVWRDAGMPKATHNKHSGGSLCVGCIEKRLGRRLVPEDFQHRAGAEGYNNYDLSTPRLRARLTGDPGEELCLGDEVEEFCEEPPLPGLGG